MWLTSFSFSDSLSLFFEASSRSSTPSRSEAEAGDTDPGGRSFFFDVVFIGAAASAVGVAAEAFPAAASFFRFSLLADFRGLRLMLLPPSPPFPKPSDKIGVRGAFGSRAVMETPAMSPSTYAPPARPAPDRRRRSVGSIQSSDNDLTSTVKLLRSTMKATLTDYVVAFLPKNFSTLSRIGFDYLFHPDVVQSIQRNVSSGKSCSLVRFT